MRKPISFTTRWLWNHISVDLALNLIVMTSMAISLWCLQIMESTFLRGILTAACGAYPAILLSGEQRTKRERSKLDIKSLAMTVMFAAILLIIISDNFGWTTLQVNLVILLGSWPLTLGLVKITSKSSFAGIIPGIAATITMIAWATLLTFNGNHHEFLLLPTIIVLPTATAWALILLCIQRMARKVRNRSILSPLLECILMTTALLPIIIPAIVIPDILNVGEKWSTITVVLAGLLFSNVISIPVRSLLLDLSNLQHEYRTDPDQTSKDENRQALTPETDQLIKK